MEDRDLWIAKAIYQLGLKHSSPKLILELMPKLEELSTEHLKSHLQKNRIHMDRTIEEFAFYHINYIVDMLENPVHLDADKRNNSDGDNGNITQEDAIAMAARKRKAQEQIIANKRKRFEEQVIKECSDVLENMNSEFTNNLRSVFEIVEQQNKQEVENHGDDDKNDNQNNHHHIHNNDGNNNHKQDNNDDNNDNDNGGGNQSDKLGDANDPKDENDNAEVSNYNKWDEGGLQIVHDTEQNEAFDFGDVDSDLDLQMS